MAATAVDPLFDRWKAMADYQIKFIDALGNYKKNVAEAELTEAQAEYENVKTEELLTIVRAKQDAVRQMELDLAALNRLRYQAQQRSVLIHDMAGNVAIIRRGQHIDSQMLTWLWQGYDFFMKLAPQEVLDELMDLPVDPKAKAGTNFVLVRDPTISCHDAPDDCDNMLQFIDWLREMRYMAKIGNIAYREVTDAFGLVGGAVQPEIDKLQEAMAAMENHTYDAWQPAQLLGLPSQPSNVAKPSDGEKPNTDAKPSTQSS
jgi:hypothetical protein